MIFNIIYKMNKIFNFFYLEKIEKWGLGIGDWGLGIGGWGGGAKPQNPKPKAQTPKTQKYI